MATPQEWATAAFDGAGLLERAVGYTRTSLQLVSRADLHAPTPCAQWDLLALLQHMNDSLAAFTDAAAIGYVDLVPVPAEDTGPEVARIILERLRGRACALLAAWSRHPPAADVAVADRPLPTGLALELLRAVPLVVSDLDRPRRFAERLVVPDYADPGTRLLAALGRRAR